MSENIIRKAWNWLTGLKLFGHGQKKTKIDSPYDLLVKTLKNYVKAMFWNSVPKETIERHIVNIILDNEKYSGYDPIHLLDRAMEQYDWEINLRKRK